MRHTEHKQAHAGGGGEGPNLEDQGNHKMAAQPTQDFNRVLNPIFLFRSRVEVKKKPHFTAII